MTGILISCTDDDRSGCEVADGDTATVANIDINFADAYAYDNAYDNADADVETTNDSGGNDAAPTSTRIDKKRRCVKRNVVSDSLSSSSHSHNSKGETPSKKKKRMKKRRSGSSNSSTALQQVAAAVVNSNCESFVEDCGDTAMNNDVSATRMRTAIATADATADADERAHATTTTTSSINAKRCAKRRISDPLSQHSSHSNNSNNGELRRHKKKKKKKKKKQHNACAHVGGLGRIDYSGQIIMSPSSTNSEHKQGDKKKYKYDSSKHKKSPKRKPSTRVRSIDPNIIPPSSFARVQNPFVSETKQSPKPSSSTKSKSKSSMKSCLKDSAKDRDTTPSPRSRDCSTSISSNGKPSATRFLVPTNDDIANAAGAAAAAIKKKSKKRSKKKTKKSQSKSKLFQKLSDSQITVSPEEDEICETPPLKRRKWKKVVQKLLKKTHLQLPHHHEHEQQHHNHHNKKAVVIADAEINDSGRTESTAAVTVAASSTSSIRVEEELPTKFVQFNPVVRVKRTMSRHDMSPNEKYAYWSSDHDDYDEYITEQILARLTEEWIRKKEEDYKEDCLQLELQLLHQQIQEAK